MALPFLLVAVEALFLRANGLRAQLALLVVTLVLVAFSYRRDRIAAACFAILAAAMIWARLFNAYAVRHAFRWDIFRGAFHHPQGPLYGRSQWIGWLVLVEIAVAVVVTLYVARRSRHPLVLAGLQLFLIVAFSFADQPPRLTRLPQHQSRFALDLDAFSPDESILDHYVERLPRLRLNTAHYPPGNLVLFRFASPAVVKVIVIAASILAGLFVYLLAPEAQALFVLSPAATVFPVTCMDASLMLISAATVWIFSRGIGARRGWFHAAGAGVGIALFTFFSFASALLALVILIQAFLARRPGLALVSFAACAGCLLLLRVGFGYDSLAGFLQALPLNRALAGGDGPFDDPLRYLFRSSGNFLGVFFAVGLPAGYAALRRVSPGAVVWIVASLAGILYLETERVLLFLVPLLMVRAAPSLDAKWQEITLVLSALYALMWHPYL